MKTYKICIYLESHDPETDEYEKECIEEYNFESEKEARALAEDMNLVWEDEITMIPTHAIRRIHFEGRNLACAKRVIITLSHDI